MQNCAAQPNYSPNPASIDSALYDGLHMFKTGLYFASQTNRTYNRLQHFLCVSINFNYIFLNCRFLKCTNSKCPVYQKYEYVKRCKLQNRLRLQIGSHV